LQNAAMYRTAARIGFARFLHPTNSTRFSGTVAATFTLTPRHQSAGPEVKTYD
jgi:hypothetical protein